MCACVCVCVCVRERERQRERELEREVCLCEDEVCGVCMCVCVCVRGVLGEGCETPLFYVYVNFSANSLIKINLLVRMSVKARGILHRHMCRCVLCTVASC